MSRSVICQPKNRSAYKIARNAPDGDRHIDLITPIPALDHHAVEVRVRHGWLQETVRSVGLNGLYTGYGI
jgi:hypothetical protein